jgi:hypothetical protein
MSGSDVVDIGRSGKDFSKELKPVSIHGLSQGKL